MSGDHVVPPALLVEPEERPRPLRVVVRDPERDRGAHPREAVDEDTKEGAIAEAHERRDVDAVEEGPGLLGGEDRGLAGLDDMPRPSDRARGIVGEDLADDEPVEEHPQRREVLLDGRGRARGRELLDVRRDHHGLHLVEGEASALAPLRESADGREVGVSGVRVADMGGEELPEAPLGAL